MSIIGTNLSLRTKAIVLAFLIVVLTLGASAGVTIVRANALVVQAHRSSLEALAAALAGTCELALVAGDRNELVRNAQSTLYTDDSLLFIAIVDPANRVVARAVRDVSEWNRFQAVGRESYHAGIVATRPVIHDQDAGAEFDLFDLSDVPSEAREDENSGADTATADRAAGADRLGAGKRRGGDVDPHDPAARHAAPPVDEGQTLIGHIVIAHSLTPIRRSQREQMQATLATTSLVAACVMPLVFIAVGRWTRRLDQLGQASRRMSEGDFAVPIRLDGVDEIGQLAKAFESMRGAIEERDRDLRTLNGSLQKQVKARTTELERALIAAEAASRAKTEFLANMSHEIRTPMTAILGYTDLMFDPDQSASDRIDCMQTIRRNGQHLLTVINDILDISKIEAGQMSVERIVCSPVQIVAEAASVMRGRAKEKGLDFEVQFEGEIPKTVLCDPTRLRQILVNLAGNAVKFTEVGGVRIRCRLEHGGAASESHLLFEVIDTGIGMSEEQIGRLFRPFTQADTSMTRKFGGTGLGLAISRRLAQLLGGDISVRCAPGQGCTFTLSVATGPLDGVEMLLNPTEALATPEAVSSAKQPAGADGGAESVASARLLLAEDGPDNQRLIGFILRKAGYEVVVAENGRIAVERALAEQATGRPFDVILMDMQMPELDGYGAAAKLRAGGYNRPIIALTAHAMVGDCEKCLAAGCDDYATKPIDRAKLIALVKGYLGVVSTKAASVPASREPRAGRAAAA